MLSITIEFPKLTGKVVKGGRQSSVTALEDNLKTADDNIVKAITSAVREASLETQAIAVDELTAAIGGHRSLVRQRVRAERVTRFRVRGTVFISGKRIPLRHFSPTQTESGVRVQVGQQSRNYRGAFGPNIPKLHGNVFVRKTKKRLPIQKMLGVSLTSIARETGLDERLAYHLRNQARIKIKRNLVRAALGLLQG